MPVITLIVHLLKLRKIHICLMCDDPVAQERKHEQLSRFKFAYYFSLLIGFTIYGVFHFIDPNQQEIDQETAELLLYLSVARIVIQSICYIVIFALDVHLLKICLLIVYHLNNENTLSKRKAIAVLVVLFSFLFIGLTRDFIVKPIMNLLVYNGTLTSDICLYNMVPY